MESETLNREPSRGMAGLPRAVWIGGGALCLTVAALAGALVTKSIDAPHAAATPPAALALADSSLAPMGGPTSARQDEVPPPPRSASPATPANEAVRAPTSRPVPLSQGVNYASNDAKVQSQQAAPVVAKPAPAPCANCGTVESVQAIKVKGQGTGVGAVAGGLLGGVVGNQFGHGNGRAAMTVLGAVGGGFAGNEVERRTHGETLFDVRVRMRDGSHRVIRESQPPAVGTRVAIEGNRLRVLNG